MSDTTDSTVLFTQKGFRRDTLRALVQWPVSRVLRQTSARHIADGCKPLVVFAFDHIAHNVNLKGVYEGKELDAFFNWIKRDNEKMFSGVAIDIGANIGNHSLYFADYFNKVYSFEPNPRTFKVLKINAELANNIQCFEVGLSDTEMKGLMEVNPTNSGGATVINSSSDHAHTINLRTLDSLIPDDEDIKLIKLDIEGHEFKALTGAKHVICRNRPVILFEQHPHDFRDGHSRVIDLLRSYGYQKFAAIEDHPQISSGRSFVAGQIVAATMALLGGSSTRVVLKHEFRAGFYPFIVAIPDWLSLD